MPGRQYGERNRNLGRKSEAHFAGDDNESVFGELLGMSSRTDCGSQTTRGVALVDLAANLAQLDLYPLLTLRRPVFRSHAAFKSFGSLTRAGQRSLTLAIGGVTTQAAWVCRCSGLVPRLSGGGGLAQAATNIAKASRTTFIRLLPWEINYKTFPRSISRSKNPPQRF